VTSESPMPESATPEPPMSESPTPESPTPEPATSVTQVPIPEPSAPQPPKRLSPVRRAVIDLDAFRSNVRTLAAAIAPAETMIAVKADAYGHGMVPMARAALQAGAASLAVLDIPAALALRDSGIDAPLFAWLHGPDSDFAAAIAAGVELGVSALWQLEAILAARGGHRPRVHLKVDTGLSRNGASEEDWPVLVRRAVEADAAGELHLRAAWSHLADASVEDDEAALARFRNAVAVAEGEGARFPLLHLAASSAGLRMPAARFGLVRFGIAAYGISPFDDATGADLGLVPAMTVESEVASVKRVPAGHGVSYGLTYRTTGESTLVLVPLGYADGVPRVAGPRAAMLLNGRRFPIAGRVAMDQVVLDVGDHPVAVGDRVVMFGPGAEGEPTAEEWADWAKTIGDEIVARIGHRVERVYRNERDA
jgi:alanine racemase